MRGEFAILATMKTKERRPQPWLLPRAAGGSAIRGHTRWPFNRSLKPDDTFGVPLDRRTIFGGKIIRVKQITQLPDIGVLPHGGLRVRDQLPHVIRPVFLIPDMPHGIGLDPEAVIAEHLLSNLQTISPAGSRPRRRSLRLRKRP
jgi:hypothetical protein